MTFLFEKEEAARKYAEENITAGPLATAHGETRQLVIRAIDSVGHTSPPYNGPMITWDFKAPAINILNINGTPGEEEYIYNTPNFEAEARINDETGQNLKVTYRLHREGDAYLSGMVLNKETPFQERTTEPGTIEPFAYTPTEPGIYELSIKAEDQAGNITEISLANLRLNHKPRIQLERAEASPEEPLTLKAEITDPDNGKKGFVYNWSLPDYPHEEITSSQSEMTVKLKHRNEKDQISTYRVVLRVTDADGGITTEENQLTIGNTKEGYVYTTEYWDSTHSITGDIGVLEWGEVIITENSAIDVEGPDHTITVMGGITMEPGAVIQMAPGYEPYWGAS